MNSFTVFDRFKFEVEDDYRLMTHDEVKETFPEEKSDLEVVLSGDEQIRLMIYHKSVNPVLLAIADKKSMRSQVISDFKKSNPDLELTETYAYMVDGKKRYGLRYKINCETNYKYGDTILLTKGGNYYLVVCRFSDNTNGVAYSVFDNFLNSIKL